MSIPETRNSLIVRLQNGSDEDAWLQFTEVYRPIIVRLALNKGLQLADAEDLAQRVLISISGAIERWQPAGKAKFRTWLKRVTDNAVLNALTRPKPDRASGSDEEQLLINELPGRNKADSALLELEYRREILYWAARQIRAEFSETTWQAFWLTAVEAQAAEDVGKRLGRNRGSIYAARSRVMRRLMEKISEFDTTEEDE